MSALELCWTSPKKLARMIRTRKVSASEVVHAFIARIEEVNPKVNAIVTFRPEQALKRAKALRKDPWEGFATTKQTLPKRSSRR